MDNQPPSNELELEICSGKDPGFEKGGDAEGSGARFSAYLGQFRGLFKAFGTKRGGRAPPAPSSGSAMFIHLIASAI